MCIQEAHKTLPALLLNDTVLLLLQGQQGLCLFHMPRCRNLTSACTLGYRLGRKSCSRRESSWKEGGTSGTQKQCAAVRWCRKMSADQHYPMLSASRPDLFVTALGYHFIRREEGTVI